MQVPPTASSPAECVVVQVHKVLLLLPTQPVTRFPLVLLVPQVLPVPLILPLLLTRLLALCLQLLL